MSAIHPVPAPLSGVDVGPKNQPAGAGLKSQQLPLARTVAEIVGKFFTYATTLAGVYLSVGFLFYYAAHEKLVTDSGTMPAGLVAAFHGSFFAKVPGDNAAWLLLGIVEASVVALLAISLLRGEFLANRTKPVLLAGLSLSLLAFGIMIVANAMIGNNATVIELFTYFGLTFVVMFLVRHLAPYRSLNWLSGIKMSQNS
jgi:hypothetical protein